MEAMNVSMSATSVYRDNDGVAWWGTLNGVVRQDQRTFRSFPTFPTPLGEWLWEIFRSDIDGTLWVSVGDLGLYQFRDGTWEKRPQPAGLPDRGPSASYHAPNGSIWLGYTENRVCVLDGGNVRAYTRSDGIEVGRVRVIRGRGPAVWVGGELGLALFDNGRFRTVACAGDEPFGTVSGIVETADGSLWLNEVHGVRHIPARTPRTRFSFVNTTSRKVSRARAR
jgi:ligand-binding sensor domain-containing protein